MARRTSMTATLNRINREAAKEAKRKEKLREIRDAEYSVDEFNEYIEDIQSLHKYSDSIQSWDDILLDKPCASKVEKAKNNYYNFKPNFIHKMFRSEESTKNKLKKAVEESEIKHANNVEQWKRDKEIAQSILNGDIDTMIDVIEEYRPLDDLLDYAMDFEITIECPEIVEIICNASIEDVVPSETRTLTKSGKLSIKNMAKTKYNELTQDYICSLNLRIALDIFALLPTVKEVMIITSTDMLNTSTGYKDNGVISKVTIDKKTIESINLYDIDPSDALEFKFNANYKFTKSKGFSILSDYSKNEINKA